MAAHTFNVVYEDAGDGWVYAHVPELPEVHTQGETLDQAREMVKDAIALVLAERGARGEAIPPTGWALVESVEICVKKRQLERHLTDHGCRLAREAAKHEIWENPAAGQRTTMPRHREIKMPTAPGICRQFGVPPPPGA
jgi:mRNA interferase HicA